MAPLRFGLSATLFLYLLSLLFLSNPHLSVESKRSDPDNIHDLLHDYGLPRGLVPGNVESYTVSSSGSFSITLTGPCVVKYSDLAYFQTEIEGKLSYGVVSEVSGILAKLPSGWVPISGVEVNGDAVELHAGGNTQTLPFELFDSVPVCLNQEARLQTHSGLNSII